MTIAPWTHPDSLYPRLEPLLSQVSNPLQYIGSEVNSQPKDWGSVDVRWCLHFPDAYAVGQPNQGMAILYEVLNECEWILAERTYSIWPDLSTLMRQHHVEQFSWETVRPIRDFDVIGVSLSTELGYTNLLETLDLAGIPRRSVDRGEHDPLVIVGGHVAANPEPIAEFVDGVVLGDGEQAVLDISAILRQSKQEGWERTEGLEALARTGRIYVPQFYEVIYGDDHTIESVTPTRSSVPAKVQKYTLTNLDEWPYPKKPIVPLAETIHERYSPEIFRGCTRGCRFCQAGMITRPVRERSAATITSMVECGLKATGYEEIGLLSLSSADHSQITEITGSLAEICDGTQVSLSLPSTRVDAFSVDLAEQLSKRGRRSGLTFAPEGGSARMRAVINKNVDEDDLLEAVRAAFTAGWRSVKLYFMAGLPSETDEDVMAIADMAHRVIDEGRRITGQRDISCTISLGAFVPKPHTSFQWAPQCLAEVVNERMRALKESIREDRQYSRAITVKWADGKPGRIEGLLARGDRRVGDVIEAVWRAGGVFDGWSEYFSYDRWVECAELVLGPQGLSIDWYTTRERSREEVLPWDHLDVGLGRTWLWKDWQASLLGKVVDDCRWSICSGCRVCPGLGVDIEMAAPGVEGRDG
ncbi:MAG: TIGR03960 family B12-binding radical SAM protein [Propionibacteriaceae bacterium]|nr:TIGR03960 family B12-binding radical SAM protein [Propionibacteriaceae bacterium]